MNTQQTPFEQNTTHEQDGDRHTYACKRGLWSVTATAKEVASKHAAHYFWQYWNDGEYVCPATTQEKIEKLRKELHAIYNNTDEGPRLINEMLKDYPYPRGSRCEKGVVMSHNLG